MSHIDCTMFNWALFRYCFALILTNRQHYYHNSTEFTARPIKMNHCPTIKRHSPPEYTTRMRLSYTISPLTIAISLSWTLFFFFLCRTSLLYNNEHDDVGPRTQDEAKLKKERKKKKAIRKQRNSFYINRLHALIGIDAKAVWPKIEWNWDFEPKTDI